MRLFLPWAKGTPPLASVFLLTPPGGVGLKVAGCQGITRPARHESARCRIAWQALQRLARFVGSNIRSGAAWRGTMWWTHSASLPQSAHSGCWLSHCRRKRCHFDPQWMPRLIRSRAFALNTGQGSVWWNASGIAAPYGDGSWKGKWRPSLPTNPSRSPLDPMPRPPHTRSTAQRVCWIIPLLVCRPPH